MYAQTDTLDRLQAMFPYVFDQNTQQPSAIPKLDLHAIDGPFEVAGRSITPILLLHGAMPVLGFRFGNFAYCTDVSEIPEASWPLLENLDVLILDALRLKPHPTHFNLEQAIDHARRIGARQTYFTHIAHEIGHAKIESDLPDGMLIAYDGLEFQSQ